MRQLGMWAWRCGAVALCVSGALAVPAVADAAGEPVMRLDQVRPGMECSVRSVLHGTQVSSFNARVIDVVAGSVTGEGPRILVRVYGPGVDETGIGPGFSGSPVSCPGVGGVSRIAGAISEGIGDTTNHLALATPIEAILSEPVAGAPRARSVALRTRPLNAPLSVSGVPGWLGRAAQAGAQRAGRRLFVAPAQALAAFAPVDLQPGSAMAAGLASGDIDVSAIGTVAYRDGARVWAFGHPLDGAGRRALLLQDAYVYGVVPTPGFVEGSYKLAAAGHVLGTLSNDASQAIVGALGRAPRTIPVTVVARDGDRGSARKTRVDVADESALDEPAGMSPLRLAGALATAQGAAEALDGAPARQTATMCARIEVRRARRPLGFCNRYLIDAGEGGFQLANTVASEVDSALAVLDARAFGRLRVESVRVRIAARRGLHAAKMTGASAPRRARAGQTLPVRVRLRAFRGPRSTATLHVRLPRSARPGPWLITLRGPRALTDEADSGIDGLLASIMGGDTGAPAPAWSLAQVARRVAALHRYDGLWARVAPTADPRSGTRARLYRSPAMRITGTSTAITTVTRPAR